MSTITPAFSSAFTYRDVRTYMFATAFIAGNIIMPQFAHIIPQGGLTWLPIYFFTLVGAYLCGWQAGVLTALLSPVVNCIAFGMPATHALPAILVKSILLAVAAAYAGRRIPATVSTMWRTFAAVACVVLFYQCAGAIFEYAITGSALAAVSDFRIGLPGIALQLTAGTIVIHLAGRHVVSRRA